MVFRTHNTPARALDRTAPAKPRRKPAPDRGETSGQRMLAELRREIVAGDFSPGARLPPRTELERRYGAGPVTVQRVFDHLAREGFVVARGRQGTFVSDAPPHTSSYALVFPYRDRPDRPWPRFWHALAAEGAKLQRPGVRLAFSYGNETHQDIEAYQQLVDDVVQQRLAGLVFASKPFYLAGSPVLETPGIPRVATTGMPGVKEVSAEDAWLPRAIGILRAAGRRRVAVLTVPLLAGFVRDELKRHGMLTRPYWVQIVHPSAVEGARNAAHMLMAANPADRPDSLLIMDDNLVEQATAGLLDAGVRAPRDVTIVAHCNFPYPAPGALPVVRLGLNVSALLATCLEVLIRVRRGEAVPDVTRVPLEVEDAAKVRK